MEDLNMKYEFSQVINGITQYINNEIYSNLSEVQEFVARLVVGRVVSNEDSIKESLINNGFIRTFGIVDSEGMVDVDALAKDLKREIDRQEKIIFHVPMFGKMTFVSSDIDELYRAITGKELIEGD
jgi:hypothetical protein